MGTNLENTAKGASAGRNAMRGAILLLVLAGILGSIYAVARHRKPAMTPEEMVTTQGDTREHGPTLAEEQEGATGLKAPAPGGQAGGAAGKSMASDDQPHPPTHYSALPGVEISSFPLSTQQHILERANKMHCTCDCKMTLAECRNEDSTCRHSLAEVAALVAEEARKDIASGLITD